MAMPRSSVAITRTDRSRWLLLALLSSSPLLPTPVQAQEDVQRVSVAGRSRDDYDALGIRLGSITLKPSVGFNVALDDNIYAQEVNQQRDAILTLSPSLVVQQKSPIATAELEVSANLERYMDQGSENSDDGFARGSVRIRPDPTLQLTSDFNLVRRAEDRRNLGSFTLAPTPVRFTSVESQVGAEKALGSLRFGLSGRVRRASYNSGTAPDGTGIDYSFRNFNIYQGTARVGFSRTGSSQLYLAGTYNRRLYDQRPGDPNFDPLTRFDRTSSGYRIELGYNRQVSALLFFMGQIGYLRQDFADSRLRDIQGLSFSGNLLYNFTPLTSVTARASRTLDETVTPLAAGNLRSEVAVRVDHELLRNLIVSADVRYADIQPSDVTEGADAADLLRFARQSQEFETGASARYLLSRKITIDGDIRYRLRSSSDPTIGFNNFVAMLGIRYGL
jgi:hypothetical protein